MWHERMARSVANPTRGDGKAFLPPAAASVTHRSVPYSLARANEALTDLRAERLTGAAVLVPGGASP